MKKFLLMLAIAASAMTASAQTEEPAKGFCGNKFWDNWYVGANAGVSSASTHQTILKYLNPSAGVRVGKWFTPYFGLGLEGTYYFSSDHRFRNDLDNAAQLMVLAQFNLSNAISGYKGEPRCFEVIVNGGIGWAHNNAKGEIGTSLNTLNQNWGIDFTWNLGEKKAWQLYVEPSINYAIAGAKEPYIDETGHGNRLVGYDLNYSALGLKVGVNYKFNTSNGTHNFKNIYECDQNEINMLNANINDLRAKNAADADQIAKLQAEVEALKKALKDCEEQPKAVVKEEIEEPNLPAVFYQVNKSVVTPAQAQNVAIAAQVLKNHPEMKLQIKGYASPEGPHDNNNDLSIRRANAVRDLLINKYKIDPSRITTEGCGETDKLFEVYEFNRVAMLYIER